MWFDLHADKATLEENVRTMFVLSPPWILLHFSQRYALFFCIYVTFVVFVFRQHHLGRRCLKKTNLDAVAVCYIDYRPFLVLVSTKSWCSRVLLYFRILNQGILEGKQYMLRVPGVAGYCSVKVYQVLGVSWLGARLISEQVCLLGMPLYFGNVLFSCFTALQIGSWYNFCLGFVDAIMTYSFQTSCDWCKMLLDLILPSFSWCEFPSYSGIGAPSGVTRSSRWKAMDSSFENRWTRMGTRM